MEPGEAALRVLGDTDEALHWTVIWDRALRAGYLDPMTQPLARDVLIRWLSDAARAGEIEKTSTGTYRSRATGEG
jgi:hypothetical protein